MATISFKPQSLRIVGLSSKIHPALLPPLLTNLHHVSQFTISPSSHCSLSCNSLPLKKKLKHLSKASSEEELPTELVEDSKFVPLDADDPRYGPPALLLLGFEVEEALKVAICLSLFGSFGNTLSDLRPWGGVRTTRPPDPALAGLYWVKQLLKDLDGEFLEVICCTEYMIGHSLWDAMNTKQQNLEVLKIAKSGPRICFLSGLTGEEMMMFIDAFPETGLEPAIFAALVPNSADKPLQELIEEIMGDHEMLSKRSS